MILSSGFKDHMIRLYINLNFPLTSCYTSNSVFVYEFFLDFFAFSFLGFEKNEGIFYQRKWLWFFFLFKSNVPKKFFIFSTYLKTYT